MLTAIAGQDMPWGIAEDVFRSTEGNPLFVQEVMRHLVEDGQIRREEGRWLGFRQSEVAMRIPEGLREVIGKRLSALSPETNRVLSIAAVIGREFRFRILQQVSGSSEEELYSALEQAQNAVIIEGRTAIGAIVRYRFTHAFFRQTLYEETIAPRRIKIHQQVARALESLHTGRLNEHAVELADHFSHSSVEEDLAKAVEYGEMAAKRAMSVFDYGEAVRSLERALQVQQVLDPHDRGKRCDLLSGLSDALIGVGEPRRALDGEIKQALSLAESLGDPVRASHVCRLAVSALTYLGLGPAISGPEAAEWARLADQYAEPNTAERVWADLSLANIDYYSRRYPRCVTYLDSALALARRLGDRTLYLRAAGQWVSGVWSPRYSERQLLLAEELADLSGSSALAGGLAHVFLAHGRRDAAERHILEVRTSAERNSLKYGLLGNMAYEGVLRYMEGRLEQVVEIADAIEIQGIEGDMSENAAVHIANIRSRSEFLLGKRPKLPQGLVDRVVNSPMECLCAYDMPEIDVPRMVRGFHKHRENYTHAENIGPTYIGILYLEASVLIGNPEAAEHLYGLLRDCGILTTSIFLTTSTGRVLGMAAAHIGRPDEAREHYEGAIEAMTDMHFRPELALTRCQMAELLLEHYPDERQDALEHLDFAIGEFKEMKMKPYIEKTQTLKEGL